MKDAGCMTKVRGKKDEVSQKMKELWDSRVQVFAHHHDVLALKYSFPDNTLLICSQLNRAPANRLPNYFQKNTVNAEHSALNLQINALKSRQTVSKVLNQTKRLWKLSHTD